MSTSPDRPRFRGTWAPVLRDPAPWRPEIRQAAAAAERTELLLFYSGHADEKGLLLGEDRYVLQVEGDSMIDAGILDGDLVAVHRTPEVRSRQIVVARLEDEVTVRLRARVDLYVPWGSYRVVVEELEPYLETEVKAIAQELGISERTLYRKIKSYEL